ncbi:MAG: fimbrial biogenesis outer membrane usher protein [Gammaproteobacteria bacterium]|nr:MAG: fimbrial biogenesis outer membrane usher protein [Gammaproteobacteria bacterium]
MDSLRRIRIFAFIACLLFGGRGAASDFEMLMVEVSLNQSTPGPAFVLRDADGGYWIEEEVIDAWRINGHRPPAVEHRGMRFFPITGFEGSTSRFDQARVRLDITIPPRFIKGQVRSVRHDVETPASSSIGVFADYDLAYQEVARGGNGLFTALLEPTFFSPAGVLRNAVLYRHGDYDTDDDSVWQDYEDDAGDEDRDGLIRLESTWVKDDPVKLRSLRLGDTILAPGMLGSAARFGGIQLATNFDTRPDLVTFPLPQFAGEALMDSTVELYVDGQLALSDDIGSGPFRYNEIPVVNGAGQLSVVTRDLTGREQVVVTDFYASQRLLRKGLSEYSYSLGSLRDDYGVESNDYDDVFVSGFHRYGINDYLTIEGQAQTSGEISRLGTGVTWALPRIGVTSIGVGVSQANSADTGAETFFAHEYRTRRYRANLAVRHSSQDYRQINDDEDRSRVKLFATLGGGVSFDRYGSLSAAVGRREFHDDGSDLNLVSLSYSNSIGRDWSLVGYGSYLDSERSDYTIGISVTRFLGQRRSANTDISLNDGQLRARAEVRSYVPRGQGYGYRLAAGRQGDEDLWEADLSANSRTGRYRLESDHNDDGLSWRASAAGSAAWIGGMPFFTREIRDAFAVVKVSGFEDVRVYLDNQEMGRTDDSGRILLPGLRPFERNRVRIDLEDIPLDARVDRLETIVTPYAGAGLLADFPASESTDVMLRLLLPDGAVASQGGYVTLEGSEERFPVGLEGSVYLRGVSDRQQALLHWQGHGCRFMVIIPAESGPVPDLGDIGCRFESESQNTRP